MEEIRAWEVNRWKPGGNGPVGHLESTWYSGVASSAARRMEFTPGLDSRNHHTNRTCKRSIVPLVAWKMLENTLDLSAVVFIFHLVFQLLMQVRSSDSGWLRVVVAQVGLLTSWFQKFGTTLFKKRDFGHPWIDTDFKGNYSISSLDIAKATGSSRDSRAGIPMPSSFFFKHIGRSMQFMCVFGFLRLRLRWWLFRSLDWFYAVRNIRNWYIISNYIL